MATGILWLIVIAATSMLYAQCQAETKVVCNSQSWLYGDRQMNWNHAVAHCRRRKGYYLAAPTNSQDLACVSQFAATPEQHRWIGISDLAREGYYYFAHNGERAQPLAWGQGQPDNLDNSEHCVVLRGSDMRYADLPCNKLFGYICQSAKVDGAWGSWQAWSQCSATCGSQGTQSRVRHCNNPSPTNGSRTCTGGSLQRQACGGVPCPVWSGWTSWSECKSICGCIQQARTRQCHSNIPGAKCGGPSQQRKRCLAATCTSQWCPAGWYTGCTKCYKTGLGRLQHYEGAKTECEQLSPGSRLLAILSEDEQIDVESFLSNRGYWVWNDITDQQREGVWMHGQTPINYTNWNRGQPNGLRRQNCASFRDPLNGVWSDVPCRYNTGLQVLCEKAHNKDFGLSNWGAWSPCSVTCGQGTRSRRRSCTWREGRCSGNVEDIQTCSLPNCPPVTCLALSPRLSYGGISGLGTRHGTKVTYLCSPGYYITSSTSQTTQQRDLTCQLNATWDKTVPTCSPVSCGEPAKPDGTQSVVTGTVFRSRQAISCGEGLRMIGDQPLVVRTCSWDNQWTPSSLPECQVITCPMLNTSKPLIVNKSSLNYGSTAQYSCIPGYRLRVTSSANRRCTANCTELQADNGGVNYTSCSDGYWEGDEPECEVASCAPLASPLNGVMTSSLGGGDVARNGSMRNFSCIRGYYLDPSTSQPRVCQFDGQWTGRDAVCLPVSCGKPGTSEHSHSAYTGTIYSSTQVISCRRGYRMHGANQLQLRSCATNKMWSPPGLPKCLPIACPRLKSSGPLQVRQTGFLYGSTTLYSCAAGYMLSAPEHSTRRCTSRCATAERGGLAHTSCEQGYWSGQASACGPVQCPHLKPVQNGGMESKAGEENLFHFGVVKEFTCVHGYHLQSNSSAHRHCQASGQWSGTDAICRPVECGKPPPVKHGWFAGGTLFLNTQLIGCQEPFYLLSASGMSTRHCSAQGKWLPEEAPVCRALSCGRIKSKTGLITNYSREVRAPHIQNATHTCAEGFMTSAEGDRNRLCTARCFHLHLSGNFYSLCRPRHAQWTGTPPTCSPKNCSRLATPDNGVMAHGKGEENEFHFATVKSFFCNKGHRLQSNSSRTRECMANGMWSGEEAICLPVQCPRLEPPRHGKMIEEASENDLFQYGLSKTFSCDTGYHRRSGTAQILRCLADGQWSSATPQCLPVGVWSTWGSWTSCPASCGCGHTTRTRQCVGARQANTDVYCHGDEAQRHYCRETDCGGTLCPTGWIPGCLKCYRLSFYPPQTYTQSLAYCGSQARDSALLSISSKEEQVDFESFILRTLVRAWIRGNARAGSSSNGTSANSSQPYENWHQMESRRGNEETCAEIGSHSDGKWARVSCKAQYQVVCELVLPTS